MTSSPPGELNLMNASRDILIGILNHLEREADRASITFQDGSAYVLRVVSTAHVEDNDDIVAEVLQVISPGAVRITNGEFMNFTLMDVARIELASDTIYSSRSTEVLQ